MTIEKIGFIGGKLFNQFTHRLPDFIETADHFDQTHDGDHRVEMLAPLSLHLGTTHPLKPDIGNPSAQRVHQTGAKRIP